MATIRFWKIRPDPPDGPLLASVLLLPADMGSPDPLHLHYSTRASRDVDEHSTHLSDWQQEYDQLSCGRFEGRVRELWLDSPRVQVFHEHTGQQTSQRCQPWKGSVWFGIPDGKSAAPLHFCGQQRSAGQDRFVLGARAGDGFVLRTPQDFGIYGVVLDESWLHENWARLGLAGTLSVAWGGASVHAASLQPQVFAALCDTIESMLRLGAAGRSAGELPAMERQAALRGHTDRLLRLLAGTVHDAAFAARLPSARRRLASVMEARSLMTDLLRPLDSVDDLCARLHVTPRTLHNHFQGVVGSAPGDFMRAVRLNACRRRLKAAPAARVQDVAADWGFFHMGRFSQDYKAMFGELPSHTLRLGRPAAPAMVAARAPSG